MRFLANYIMRGPMPAILVTAVTAVLPFFGYLSGAAVGLVTLRLGASKGAWVALGATAVLTLLALLTSGNAFLGPLYMLVVWLPVWGLAMSLRRTASLPRAVLLAGLFGAGLVVGIHLAIDDPSAWWRQLLAEAVSKNPNIEQGPQVTATLDELAGLMTRLVGAAFSLGALVSLFLARWWQALLYNPGGFREEFHSLRLGRNLSIGIMVLMLIAGTVQGAPGQVAGDLLVVGMVLYLLQGLAVVHGLVGRSGAGAGWLVGVYVLLVVAMPQTAITLALAGLVDTWFDFRRYFGANSES